MRTASWRYRGHRIKAIQLGSTWHASVHGRTGSILIISDSTPLADTMAKAEWAIETRLKLQRPRAASGGVVSELDGAISRPFSHLSTKHA
jgi:hypothetical protein